MVNVAYRRPVWRRPAVPRALVLLVLAGLVWAFLAAFAARRGLFDLKVYYGALQYWTGGHGEIYDFLRKGSKYGFTYPPFAALAMLPMGYLPWPVVITVSWLATAVVTLVLLAWLLDPVIARFGWTRWYALGVALALAAVFEPLRETVNFGQVNMLLVALVVGDQVLLIGRGDRRGGVGIGLAAAIKLTPGLFVLYLLLARRYRAAGVAVLTAGTATVLAAAVAPDASMEFWTRALWDTDRIGQLSFISNQSWQGLVARLDPLHPSTALWLALVAATLAVWAWRVRAAVRAGDELAGVALTGVAGALVSPVTWVHHLVWLLPALLLLVRRGLVAAGRRRLWLLGLAGGLYVLLSSRLVWGYEFHVTGWGLLAGNAYVYASVLLLVLLPLGGDPPVPVPSTVDGTVPELSTVAGGSR